MASKRVKAPERVYVLISGEGSLLGVMRSRKERGDFQKCPSDMLHEYRLVTPPKKRAGGRRK